MFERIQMIRLKNKDIKFNGVIYETRGRAIIIAKCVDDIGFDMGILVFGPFDAADQNELKRIIGCDRIDKDTIDRWREYKDILQKWVNGYDCFHIDTLFCRMNTVDEMRNFLQYYHYDECRKCETIAMLAFMGIKKIKDAGDSDTDIISGDD